LSSTILSNPSQPSTMTGDHEYVAVLMDCSWKCHKIVFKVVMQKFDFSNFCITTLKTPSLPGPHSLRSPTPNTLGRQAGNHHHLPILFLLSPLSYANEVYTFPSFFSQLAMDACIPRIRIQQDTCNARTHRQSREECSCRLGIQARYRAILFSQLREGCLCCLRIYVDIALRSSLN